MLDSQTLNQIAAASEAVVEKQFRKLRYSVRRLDRNAKRPRPDFLISNRAGHPEMLCEVKTVHSAGTCKIETPTFQRWMKDFTTPEYLKIRLT